jgi:hypothetical protein
MGSLAVTLLPSAVNSRNAKWAISGVPGWHLSGAVVTVANGSYTVEYRPIEDYMTPVAETVAVSGTTTKNTTYPAQAWPSSWGPPITACLFRGQVVVGGRITAPVADDTRRMRWGEIGAFRFLGATADSKKNEAGEAYLADVPNEMLMALLPLKVGVVVYSSSTIFVLEPVAAPAPTFGKKPLLPIGIANPLACCGNSVAGKDDATEHLCVDRKGNLRIISISQYGAVVSQNLGFQPIFEPMQKDLDLTTGKGMISICYNPGEDEYYISNGERSYVYNKHSLTEIGTAITSFVDLVRVPTLTDFGTFKSTPIGFAQELTSKEFIYLETDIIDFSLLALKTVMCVDVSGSFGEKSRMSVSVKWRMSRSAGWRQSPWKRCTPEGSCMPIVAGSEFKFCVMVTPVLGTSLDSLTIEWKLTDKRGIRGTYASGSTPDTGG